MHVGMASVFQNPKQSRADREIYRNELRLVDLAEPLGFESVWGVEHHFTDYTMCPDVLQMLTYFAGRSRYGKTETAINQFLHLVRAGHGGRPSGGTDAP